MLSNTFALNVSMRESASMGLTSRYAAKQSTREPVVTTTKHCPIDFTCGTRLSESGFSSSDQMFVPVVAVCAICIVASMSRVVFSIAAIFLARLDVCSFAQTPQAVMAAATVETTGIKSGIAIASFTNLAGAEVFRWGS